MLERENIQSRGFRNITENGKVIGFQVPFRSRYYRGIWISMLENASVIVDGERFEGDQITWTISGKTYAQNDLVNHKDVQWPNYEPAVLNIKRPGGLELGIHDVEVTYTYRNSYTAAASRNNWMVDNVFTRRMTLVK